MNQFRYYENHPPNEIPSPAIIAISITFVNFCLSFGCMHRVTLCIIKIYCIVLFLQKLVNVTINQLYFAVKTWSNNHVERLPIVQRTWAKETKFIRYFSDVEGAIKFSCFNNVICQWNEYYRRFTNVTSFLFVANVLFCRCIDTNHKYKYSQHRSGTL